MNSCKFFLVFALVFFGLLNTHSSPLEAYNRTAYFGDLHVHTKLSHDSFMFQVRATPDDAYRYALGKSIQHISGYPIRLHDGPLDFTAITDHGELLGIMTAMMDPDSPMSKLDWAKNIQSSDRKVKIKAFIDIIKDSASRGDQSAARNMPVMRSAWQEIIAAAERYNDPGTFTTFVGYEYSSSPKNQNLHRNVIFKGSDVPEMPFSSIESDNPEDLWRWMDSIRDRGIEVLAIPHNSNVSNGLMFERTDWSGKPLNAEYAQLRMRNEPLVEITQVKGTSETHPILSPNDEWADFELYDTLIASKVVSKKSGSFVRDAYRAGLVISESIAANPYQFGVIGSTDTHNAGGSTEEKYYSGKVGVFDGTAKRRGTVPSSTPGRFGAADAATTFTQWGASGLAGIWANENNRNSLFNAMKRKETFATSGPRIKVRLFASFNYPDSLASEKEMIKTAYEKGVPMGATLRGSVINDRPSFLALANQDMNSTALQRIQIVKGWTSEGVSYEKVFDIACSDGLKPDPQNYRCPDNHAEVDLSDCSPDKNKGAAELKVLWKDPLFQSKQNAFYYLRVLENPSCRWSSWDALRAGAKPKDGLAITIQERAWSSPIWYQP